MNMTDKIAVVVDAGHGGKETGAVSNGFVEKDLNLKVALILEQKLKSIFKNVHMTRMQDVDLSLSKRGKIVSDIAHNFDGKTICLSVHFNAYNGEARGVETIHSIFSKPDLATRLLESIMELGLPKRRVFSKKSSRGYFDWYAMHRLTGKAQTVILEPLFLDNLEDIKLLKQDGFLDRLADKYVEGLLNYLGIHEDIDVVDTKVTTDVKEYTKEKIMDVGEALKVLVKYEVINSPRYWKSVLSVVKYFDVFVINVANKLKQLKE